MKKHYFVQLNTGLIIESLVKISYNDKLNCFLDTAKITTNTFITISKNAENIVFNLSNVVLSWEKDFDKI